VGFRARADEDAERRIRLGERYGDEIVQAQQQDRKNEAKPGSAAKRTRTSNRAREP
jgi:hypothetical protein